MTTLYKVPTGFATSSGGSATETPTPTDLVVLDLNSGNWTLTANYGSIVDNGGGDIMVTPGLLGVQIAGSYTGTLAIGAFTLAVGESGLDATGAGGAAVSGSAGGKIGIAGPVASGEAPYWLGSPASVSLDSVELYTTGRVSIKGSGRKVCGTIRQAAEGYIVVESSANTASSVHVWGVVDVASSQTFTVRGFSLYSGSSVTGSGIWYAIGSFGISVESGVLVDVATALIEISGVCTLPAATWDCGVFRVHQYITTDRSDTVTLAAGEHRFGGKFRCSATVSGAISPVVTMMIDGEANSPDIFIGGNIERTSSGGSSPIYHLHFSGRVQLTGTADQSIDIGQFETVPIFADGGKTAGNVEVVSGTFEVDDGDYVNLRAGSISATAAVTGEGEIGITPGFSNSGQLDVASLRLIDWDATDVPEWSGAIVFEVTAEAIGDISPKLSGSYDWTSVQFQINGNHDLIIDCANVVVIAAGGDVVSTETGSGRLRWIRGEEKLRLDGSGDQILDLQLSVHGEHIIHAIEVNKSSGDVVVAAGIWCELFEGIDGIAPSGIHVLSGACHQITDGAAAMHYLAFQLVPDNSIDGVFQGISCTTTFPSAHPMMKRS